MNSRPNPRELLLDAALAAVVLVAVLLATLSLTWPAVRDLPLMLYEGFLAQDLGLFPYRDYFEMNAPGTVLLFSILYRITGGTDLALRCADLAWLAGIGFFSFLALGRHGWRSGLLAASLFGALFLSAGAENSLQREYLCILPLAVSVAMIFRRQDLFRGKLYPLLVAGLMMGLVFTLKPPLILCWIPLFACELAAEEERWKDWGKKLALVAAGALAPILVVMGWLAAHGALAPYLDMAANYYSLYTQIDGKGVVLTGGLGELWHRYVLRTLPLLAVAGVAPALLGLLAGSRLANRRLRLQNAAAAGLIVAAALYVPISVKFWLYHKIPITYALTLAAAMVLSRQLPESEREGGWLRDLVVAGALLVSLPLTQLINQMDYAQDARKAFRGPQLDQMIAYLRDHTTSADTILPMDTSTGAIHALYDLRRPLYGRFIYDFHLYHHAELPYIQDLRRQFLAQFSEGRPTVVLRCESWRPRQGESAGFPELEAILRSQYSAVLESNGCTVLRRHRDG